MYGSKSWQSLFEVFRSSLGLLSTAFVVVAPASCCTEQEDSVVRVCSFDLVISIFWARSSQGQSPWTATRVGEAANPGPVVDADSDDTFDQQIGLEEEYLQATAIMTTDDAHGPFLPDEIFYDENEQAPGESVHPRPHFSEVAPGCGYPPPPASHPQDPGKNREERASPGSHGPVAEEPVGSGVGSPGIPPPNPPRTPQKKVKQKAQSRATRRCDHGLVIFLPPPPSPQGRCRSRIRRGPSTCSLRSGWENWWSTCGMQPTTFVMETAALRAG